MLCTILSIVVTALAFIGLLGLFQTARGKVDKPPQINASWWALFLGVGGIVALIYFHQYFNLC